MEGMIAQGEVLFFRQAAEDGNAAEDGTCFIAGGEVCHGNSVIAVSQDEFLIILAIDYDGFAVVIEHPAGSGVRRQ